MHAESRAVPPYALDTFLKVKKAFSLTEAEILSGQDKLAYAARTAVVYVLMRAGYSRHEYWRAVGRTDQGRPIYELEERARRFAIDPETRHFFVAATEAP